MQKLGSLNAPSITTRFPAKKPDDIVKDVFQQKSGSKFLVYRQLLEEKKVSFPKEITKWLKRGFVKLVLMVSGLN